MMMVPRRNEFDLLDDMFKNSFFDSKNKIMKTDIKENKDNYTIILDLPGYDKKDIKISVDNGYLTISAKTTENKEDKEDGQFVRQERFYGECSRSFYVGKDIESEDIKAKFKNGTLNLIVPKKEETKKLPETKYVQIED